MRNLLKAVALAVGTSLMATESGIFVDGVKVDAVYYAKADKSSFDAAKDLQSYLERITGEKIFLKPGLGEEKNGIFIGNAFVQGKIRAALKLPPDDLEYIVCIAETGKLYIFGNDSNQYPGTRWAVSRFLDRNCGVRWLWPGKLGEVIPQKTRIEVAKGTEIEQPDFRVRCWSWLYFGLGGYYAKNESEELREWARIRHHFGSSIPGYKGEMGFGHAFSALVPQEQYGKEHPEYYSLVSPHNWSGAVKPIAPARTNSNDYWQLCTSNPEVRQVVAEQIIAKQTKGLVSISPNDGYMFCECENCRKLDKERWTSLYDFPDLSNRIFDFAADVCARVKKSNPDGKVGMFSYSFFSDAPDCLEELPDNLFLSMTYRAAGFRNPEKKMLFEKRIKKYNKLKAQFIGREYWSDHTICSMPWLHTKLLAENLKFIKKHGAVGVYGEAGKDWANNALNYYVMARLMWDSTLQLDEIVNDFCNHAFGSAAEEMKRYFSFLEQHIDDFYADRLRNNLPFRDDSYGGMMQTFIDLYTPEFVREGNRILNAAVRAAKAPEDKKRVEYFRIGLNYSLVFTDTLKAYRKAVACGLHLVFISPEPGIECIDDALLQKTFTEADRAGSRRLSYLLRYQGTHAVDSGVMLYIGRTKSMPWDRVVQDQLLIHQQGYYNYLVNGAFEYDFAWDFHPLKGKATSEIDMSKCHDSEHNSMAMYHGKQGRSLKVILSPDSVFASDSTVKVKTPAGRTWQLDGFILHGSPDTEISAEIEYDDGAGKKVMMLRRCNDEIIREKSGWEPLRFHPFTLPCKNDTTMRLRLKVGNHGKNDAVVNLDNFRLMIAK